MTSQLGRELAEAVDLQYLKQVVVDMVNIPSPTGSEQQMGEYMARRMRELGMEVIWQEVEEGRPNVIGILRGDGSGPSLGFDGHLDVSFTGTEEFMFGGASAPVASIRTINGEEWIFGAGSFNMKGALGAYLAAAKAVVDSKLKLKGDLMIIAVCGEIEASQVDEFRGKRYRGYGTGAKYAASHGILPDYVVIGEPTGLNLMVGHFGSLWVKLTARGGTVIHTAWSRGVPNKIEQFSKVIDAVASWGRMFAEKATYKGYKGIVNMAAISGGLPWKGSRTPESVSLYLDIRYPPGWSAKQVLAELNALAESLNREDPKLNLVVQPYAINPPTEVDEEDRIVRAVKSAHKEVFGVEPKITYELWYSDAPTYNALGAKAINYGPSGAKRIEGLTLSDRDREYINVNDLYNCTKVYAHVIADICMGKK